jgi:selenocysteine-specific elongation factor
VHLGTARSPGRIVWRSATVAEIRLERPLPAAAGLVAVLRGSDKRGAFGRVLGGAVLLDVDAERTRGKQQRELTARAFHSLSTGAIGEGLLDLLRARAPRSLAIDVAEHRVGLEHGAARALVAQLVEKGELVSTGQRWLLGSSLSELTSRAVRELERFHREQPHAPGLSRETLRDALVRAGDVTGAELVLDRLIESRRAVTLDGGLLAVPRALDEAAADRNTTRERVAERLLAAGLAGAVENDLAAATDITIPQARATLSDLARRAEARRLGGLWFSEVALAGLRQRVREHFARKPTLSVPELKTLAGVSRKQAIPLLEELDREGVTRRRGDDRVAGTKASG